MTAPRAARAGEDGQDGPDWGGCVRPYFEQRGIIGYAGRAEEVLPSLPDQSVDLIATDPPYFRVKDEPWDRQWSTTDGFLAWLASMMDEWRRLLKPNGSLYVFASADLAWQVEGLVRERFAWLNTIRWEKEAGWHNKADEAALRSYLSPWEAIVFAEQPAGDQPANEYEAVSLALHKQVYAPIGRVIAQRRAVAGLSRGEVDAACSPSRKPTGLCYRWEEGACLPTPEQFTVFLRLCGDERPDEALRADYEALRADYEALRADYEALRADYEALRRPFTLDRRAPRTDIWRFATVQPSDQKHPCQKPLDMMRYIVRSSSREDGLILDPFMGSGTTLVAAQIEGRRAIGIEAEPRYCQMARRRLEDPPLLKLARDDRQLNIFDSEESA